MTRMMPLQLMEGDTLIYSARPIPGNEASIWRTINRLFRMPINEEIQKIILAAGTSIQIAEQAQRDGVRDLRQSGLIKVRTGATTLEEVISVTNE